MEDNLLPRQDDYTNQVANGLTTSSDSKASNSKLKIVY